MNTLVKIVGFPATLIHGDTLVWDRWRWLKKRLPKANGQKLIDVGCGSGAFTIGTAKKGFNSLGLSWDTRNQVVAAERAQLSGVTKNIQFDIQDVRKLDERAEYKQQFDVAICLEVIEHILNDQKVLNDISGTLKKGGKLLLTAPFFGYKAIVPSDNGPFLTIETGWHVRRGYWEKDLRPMLEKAGFEVQEVNYCSGYFSQKITGIMWRNQHKAKILTWLIILPLRILPPLFDGIIRKLTKWPDYSIGVVAKKI